jgi:hypothetical protein
MAKEVKQVEVSEYLTLGGDSGSTSCTKPVKLYSFRSDRGFLQPLLQRRVVRVQLLQFRQQYLHIL